MLLDVVEKSPSFMFINYRDISPSWEGGKYNLLHHRTRNSSLGAVGSGLFVDSMCVFRFFFYREKKLGGRRIWDSIYGQDGKPTQMSGVKNSFSWQVKEVCSLGLADVFLSLALCYSWRAWLSAADILQTYLQVFSFLTWKSYNTTGWKDKRHNWCVVGVQFISQASWSKATGAMLLLTAL